MGDATYYKCEACGYEFLSKPEGAKCPRCGGGKLENKDIHGLAGLDE